NAKAILLEKHATICWRATVDEAYVATVELISRAEGAIVHKARIRVRFGGATVPALPPEERRRVALSVVPALRGLVSRDRPVLVSFDDSPDVLDFACSGEAGDLSRIGPATPDHTTYTKRLT